MFRIAFDPDRPLVASSGFTAGEEQIAAGAVFDWRARGIPQIDALAMFRSGLLVHPSTDVPEVSMSLPGVASPELGEKLEQRERNDRKRRDRR